MTARRADSFLGPGRVDAYRIFPELRLLLHPSIEALRGLAVGWDGYKATPPNDAALDRMDRFLRLLRADGVEPGRVVPDASGGVASYFFATPASRQRYVELTCANDGVDCLLFTDRVSGAMAAEEIADPARFALLAPKIQAWIR